MIRFAENGRWFHLATDHTSYIFQILPSGHLSHRYYGSAVSTVDSITELVMKHPLEVGSQVAYDEKDKTFSLNMTPLELSTCGKGDFRDPMLHFRLRDGSRVTDFTYRSHEILSLKPHFPEMPETFDASGTASETLKVTMRDEVADLEVDLLYTVFSSVDCIARRAVIRNGKNPVRIDKAMSLNLDFPEADFELLTLDGAWIRERHLHSRPLLFGTVRIDSKKGVSSADHNPFFALRRKHTDEQVGECYGFSLVYSGNFEATAEVNPHSLLRILMGINSFDFEWNLEPNDSFVTPESVLTFSANGLSGMSQNLHELINRHVIDPAWQQKDRPILLNNWEATGFDFKEAKLLRLARTAKKLGIELFVLDDGWFGKRDDDTTSLGDWTPNPRKLPSGLGGLAAKIRGMGLDFGIWVEPEMVSEDSHLYRAHPEWVIRLPDRVPSKGRNQLILDLSQSAVRDYLFDALAGVFDAGGVSYCKWDMNRNFSDMYSLPLGPERQGEFFHRYVLGLYDLLGRLKQRFPRVLFESCASGGNRFDLGMLYYMPQTWTSDDTDGIERLYIQYGTSMVYPLSTMGAHVSAVPNMQTIRNTPLETRFNTAIFGLLGYELDLTRCNPFEKKVIRKQIAFYKEHRHLLQFGKFTRMASPFSGNECLWMVSSAQGDEALVGVYQVLARPNGPLQKIQIPGLDAKKTFQIRNRPQYFNLRTFGDLVRHALPIRLRADGMLFNALSNRYLMSAETEDLRVEGDLLQSFGFIPKQPFIGTGYNDQVRLMGDFGSRIYHLRAERKS
ncbi:MAG TPA: alpha-galactosidase [Bacillota bacterium]|nr:alpha-galactosidase [Bacillota bacterium]